MSYIGGESKLPVCWNSDTLTVYSIISRTSRSYDVGDVFMGYHDDTCSAVVLHVWKEFDHGERRSVMNQVY